MDLDQLGWDSHFHHCFSLLDTKAYDRARIAGQERNRYAIMTETSVLGASVSGRFRNNVVWRSDFPCVGDWVAITCSVDRNHATIHHVLPRKSAFSRKCAGVDTEEQVLAANIDTVLLMSGLDQEFNVRRLERYLLLGRQSGASPVIVLNKSDLCHDIAARTSETESVAAGIPVHVVSVHENRGINDLEQYFSQGKTVAVLGSSGVGKSSLVNHLLAEDRQQVKAVRICDSRGRHTTTSRELIQLPSGGMIIDTPGLKEVQLWAGNEQLGNTFEDVEDLAKCCHFRDCCHDLEPGCAVRDAVESGLLSHDRLRNYRQFLAELRHIEKRKRERTVLEEKSRSKKSNQPHRRDFKRQQRWTY